MGWIPERGNWFFKGLVIIVAVFLLDQLSKWGIVEHLFRPEIYARSLPFWTWLVTPGDLIGFASIQVTYLLNFVIIWNDGVSFGMLQDMGDMAPVFLSAMAGIVCIGLLVWLYQVNNMIAGVGLSFIIAGSLGNILDRLRFGAVIDFLDFHVLSYHWPAFNIADAAICVGVFLIIIETLLYKRDNSDLKRM